ncbi:dihydrolipoamide succinyltransferase [Oleiphilus sp. HI0071]|jgi:2-oxoglutarate dehydrogenase E2 component (dihydrolipoamide succinyltransferase)|uniref:2-oxoglutarate dehydrogenase complex dihydrolipoyllysine-residue succinyltransferase n=1 Tax=unclassified Oleiphilus TaxID=2631174 RepID=UPI0007C3D4AC|nr:MULTISPECIES: 2-oxoglutarate dehydrogenase complex dihydrolipoyllysine-residue succinyltransferase [unclassified Oleiphilus]KZY74784.1 dihydrolipoamide succinyltransferase [Oleiphilus sp. HI0065]KZY87095.1 dihydrolipoamide succinyltransferase [Oleiphilus sp. HI0071]KZY91263.1 dihydrolipoamide succinyltransferase [Oleiphilus sp. HI0073]KZZ42287.1 dihydrolipoamide succinyltransferase [Oleiphilus sp. HI0118]KZZ60267.1 dihydrolipoamide succinyltransferase [Oleiphilus sp. HI0122]KZZ75158.1 dihy
MSKEIKAPTFPESVADGTIATWHKKPGEQVSRDELIVDIETDKVVLEVVAPDDGVISEIVKNEGDVVLSGELIGRFDAGASGTASSDEPSQEPASEEKTKQEPAADIVMSPAARKLVDENDVDPSQVPASGKDGRLTKEDIVKYLSEKGSSSAPASAAPVAATPDSPQFVGERPEKRVPMTRLRSSIARRLLDASQNTAMLTTFNEVNMKPLMELRKQYKDLFEKTHNGTKLGFMSLFVKAAAEALKRFPAVNASIDGNDIVYHGYQDIGVAVSTEKGLVVPILRDADTMSLAKIESSIKEFGGKARDGKLTIEEMTGGTFTISNGGVFGSLMSTPILNPPQTAILGMHKIQERPMAVNGEVVILPMMYLALSYDHRMIDGKEAVQFLVTIKELIEDPARILLDI